MFKSHVFKTAATISMLVSTTMMWVASPAVHISAQGTCPTAKSSYKIGFANLTEGVDFTTLVEKSIVDDAKAAGINLVLANNNLDGATALNNAQNFVTQGVDGVIEFQTDEAFGNVIMNLFQSQTPAIPVIAIDIPMPGATFFGANNYKAGLMAGNAAGDYANANWGGKVDYVLSLDLPQSGAIPAARMQGQLDGLQSKLTTKVPDAHVIHLDSKNTQDEAFKVVSDALSKIPTDANIIGVEINDDTAQGTAAAIEATNRTGKAIIVGQGAVPSGQIEMVKPNSLYLGATAYFPEKYGDKIIPAMLDLLNCKSVPPAIYTDHVFITKANLCQYYPDGDACKTLTGGAATAAPTAAATASS